MQLFFNLLLRLSICIIRALCLQLTHAVAFPCQSFLFLTLNGTSLKKNRGCVIKLPVTTL